MSEHVEKWRLAMAEWLDAKSAAAMLRETKNDVFAQICMQMEASTNAERERLARCSDTWKEFRDGMLKAEELERRLHARVKYRQMKFDAWRTEAANSRQERGAYT